MSLPLYKDIAKASNDLRTKSFVFDLEKNKDKTATVEVKTTTDNGVEFTATHELSGANSNSILNTKLSYANFNYEPKFSTGKEYEATLKANKLFPGLVTIFSGKVNEGKKDKDGKPKAPVYEGNVGFEYTHELAKGKFNAELVDRKLAGSFTTAAQGFGFGAEFDTPMSFDEVNYNGSLYFNNATSTAVLSTETVKKVEKSDKGPEQAAIPAGILAFSYFHNLSKSSKVGGKFSYQVNTKKPSFEFVGQHQLDGNSLVKAKVNEGGDVFAHYQVNLASNVKLGVTGLSKISANSAAQSKLGFALFFGEI